MKCINTKALFCITNISAIPWQKTSLTCTLQTTVVRITEIRISRYGLFNYRNYYRYAGGAETYNL